MESIKNINDYLKKMAIYLYQYEIEISLDVGIGLFVFAYILSSGTRLPRFLSYLFKLSIFRIFILSFIVFKGQKNPILALIISIFYLLITDKIKKEELFMNVVKKTTLETFAEDQPKDNSNSKEIECPNRPMPGRIVIGIQKMENGGCNFDYFRMPDEEPDCSLCLNRPPEGMTVLECKDHALNGICEYTLIERDSILPETRGPEITDDEIVQPIDPSVIEQELKEIDDKIDDDINKNKDLVDPQDLETINELKNEEEKTNNEIKKIQ